MWLIILVSYIYDYLFKYQFNYFFTFRNQKFETHNRCTYKSNISVWFHSRLGLLSVI